MGVKEISGGFLTDAGVVSPPAGVKELLRSDTDNLQNCKYCNDCLIFANGESQLSACVTGF